MNKLKVLELFGGIGACSKAIERYGYEDDLKIESKPILKILKGEEDD